MSPFLLLQVFHLFLDDSLVSTRRMACNQLHPSPTPFARKPRPLLPLLLCGQGVNFFFQHKVTRAYPSAKSSTGATVRVTDLDSYEDFTITTDKAVLNIPAEVRRTSARCWS